MYKKPLLVLLALVAFGTSTMSQNNIVYPYNPDSDTDGYISTIDLLELLGIYSSEFTIGEIFVDGVSLGEVMINVQSLIQASSTQGTATGQLLRWNDATGNWEPELVLDNLQINDMTVNQNAIFLQAVSIAGPLAASSVVVSSSLSASSINVTNGNLNVYSGDVTAVDNTLSGNLSIGGHVISSLSVKGTDASALAADASDPISFPLKVQGGNSGILIGIKSDPDWTGDVLTGFGNNASNNTFIEFGTGSHLEDGDTYKKRGAIVGNAVKSHISELYNYISELMGGTAASNSFVETCPWTLSVTGLQSGDFVKVTVQNARQNTFPEGYATNFGMTLQYQTNYTSDVGYNCVPGDPDYFLTCDFDANDWICQGNECWKHINYSGGSDAITLYVPDNRTVKIEKSPSASSYSFQIQLTSPEGIEKINQTVSSLDTFEATHWEFCPSDPPASGENSGGGGYNQSSSDLTDAQSSLSELSGAQSLVESAIAEIVLIINIIKSTINLVVSLWPPGSGFDVFDIVDCAFEMACAYIDISLHYAGMLGDLGVSYESEGADYAEWLPKYDINENFYFGDVVGVVDGQVSKSFTQADHFMVISKAPMVLGNTPGAKENEDNFVKVAFLGQVPVKVSGAVEYGDYILISGKGDGLATSKNPDLMTTNDYEKIVGIAWSETENIYLRTSNYINTAIGLNRNDMSGEVGKLERNIEKLESHILELEGVMNELMAMFSEIIPGYAPDYFLEEEPEEIIYSDIHESEELALHSQHTTKLEAEFAGLVMSNLNENSGLTREGRIAVAAKVEEILHERLGVNIREEMPLILNIIEDPHYALMMKAHFEADLRYIYSLVPSLKDIKETETKELKSDSRK